MAATYNSKPAPPPLDKLSTVNEDEELENEKPTQQFTQ